MKLLCWIGVGLMLITMYGCASAWSKKIGTDRYEINAIAGPIVGSADDNFTDKARELCPNGHRVVERHTSSGEVTGTVECE